MEFVSEKEFDFGVIKYTSDSIFVAKIKDEAEMDLDALKLLQAHLTEVAGNNKFGMVTEFEGSFHSTPESREYLSKHGHPNRIAICFVSSALPVRLVFNFFLKINKPDVPTRLFANLGDAYEWLLSQKGN